jgi:hypothetical protein
MKLAAALLGLSLALPLAAAPIHITGRVSGEKAGLAGARLELFSAYESYADAVRRLTEKTGPAPIAKAVTDEDGAFEILVSESGCFRVVVRAEGYLAQEITSLPVVEDVELPSTTLMRPSPMKVRTVGPDGRPLAGIEVRALDASPFSRRFRGIGHPAWQWVRPSAVSDKEGRVSIPIYPQYGPLSVVANSPRFLGQTATGNAGEVTTLRLVPNRVGWIEARGADDKPVPGVLARWKGWPVGITGADGRLETAVPEEESALILESREGWGARVLRAEGKGILPVRLVPPRRIAGRVVDSVNRKPVAGALVWSGSPLVAPAVHSDAEGAFLLEVPASEEIWLEGGAAGFLAGERQLAKKGPEPAVLTLAPSAALSGLTVDSGGRPVSGVKITLEYMKGRQGIQETARSRADGRFRFLRLPPAGTFELRAVHLGFAETKATARTAPAGQPSPEARIVMADGQTAFGRVMDEGDRPVEGAALTLRSGQLLLDAISDGEGKFEFRHLSPGKISLMATHPRHAPSLLDEIEIPAAVPRVDLGVVKMPESEAIEGRVTDSRGGPIAGAEIEVYSEMSGFRGGWMELRENKEVPLQTGLDGSFRAERLEGGRRYNLKVQHAGYAEASLPGVEAPTLEPLRIEMKTARNLSGQVVGPEGEPVAGASLSWIEEVRTGGGSHATMDFLGRTTDADGKFRASGLRPGPLTLDIVAKGYSPRRTEGIQIPEDKDLEDLKLVLSRGSVLDVQVLTAEGEPVGDAWVYATPESREERQTPMFMGGLGRDRTDSAGRCKLTLFEAGAYRVEAHGSGLSTWARVVAGPGITPVELRFPAGVEVSGRVIGEDGSGIAGASVLLEEGIGGGRGGSTGPDGTFVLATVTDGAYRLKATWKELTSASLDFTVAGNPVRGLELRLDQEAEPLATLTGRVLGLAPEEMARVRVDASSAKGVDFHSGSTNAEGTYRIEKLEPGEWSLRAFTRSGRQASGTLQIPAGAREATLDLEFRKGFTLAGRVLLDGKPLPGADVAAWDKERSIASARTAYDGSFTLRGLEAGAVTLLITSTKGFAGTHTVLVKEDQDVSIPLATGRLSGRVATVTGEPVEDATVSVDAWIPGPQTSVSAPGTRTGADGAFEIPKLGAGTYKVKIQKEGFAPTEVAAEVPPGGSAPPVEIVLKFREGPP